MVCVNDRTNRYDPSRMICLEVCYLAASVASGCDTLPPYLDRSCDTTRSNEARVVRYHPPG
eukprot:631105-Prymnesium_polylepis.1